MAEKRLNFPSMDDPEGDEGDSDLYYQNDNGEYEAYEPPSWAEDFFDDGEIDNDEIRGDESNDAILDGELEAYNLAKDLIGGEGDSFQYFPSDAGEENNRRFSMAQLKEIWGSETKRNIGIANFFYKNFLEAGLRRQAESSGIASHYLLIEGFYKAAKHTKKIALQQLRGESEMRTLRFKGMDGVVKQKLEERCREMASRVYSDAMAKIIKLHGSIKHGSQA